MPLSAGRPNINTLSATQYGSNKTYTEIDTFCMGIIQLVIYQYE